MNGVIGRRYAKALINLTATQQLATTAEELAHIAALYQESAEFKQLIRAPKYSLQNKIQAVGAIAQKAQCGKEVVHFLRFLTHQGRFEVIEQVSGSFTAQAEKKLGTTKAKLTLAEEINPTDLDKIQKQLSFVTKKDVTLEVQLDPAILGGAVAQIGSQVFDGSIQNRLKRLRETISKGI